MDGCAPPYTIPAEEGRRCAFQPLSGRRTAGTDNLRPQRRRQVGVSESRGPDTVHAAMRHARAAAPHFGVRPLRQHIHRHRRPAEHRQRPLHIHVAPAEHEDAACRSQGRHPLPARRAGRRHRTEKRLRHSRSRAGGTLRQRELRGGDDPLRRPEAAGRPHARGCQRSHALRHRGHAAPLPAGCGSPRQQLRLRDCREHRLPQGGARQSRREGGPRAAELRAPAAAAGDRQARDSAPERGAARGRRVSG